MKEYAWGVIRRSARQFSFFIGRSLILSLFLIVVSSGIRGSGDAELGHLYYYLVMPGVVCHETAHAAACLCTGNRIVEFAPFKPHGDVLGYVQWDPGDVTLWTFFAAFLIGTAPLWFGCALVWLICRLLVKTRFLPDPRSDQVMIPQAGFSYWSQVVRAAFAMMKSLLKNWNFTSVLNIVILYFLFCIISEMPPSIPDLQTGLPGIGLLLIFFVILNLIPFIGIKVNLLTIRLRPLFFMIHSVIVFVLMLDLLLALCIMLPLSILR